MASVEKEAHGFTPAEQEAIFRGIVACRNTMVKKYIKKKYKKYLSFFGNTLFLS
jgi:uncharacterized protein YutE (UPF0331/DUF86 family)